MLRCYSVYARQSLIWACRHVQAQPATLATGFRVHGFTYPNRLHVTAPPARLPCPLQGGWVALLIIVHIELLFPSRVFRELHGPHLPLAGRCSHRLWWPVSRPWADGAGAGRERSLAGSLQTRWEQLAASSAAVGNSQKRVQLHWLAAPASRLV